MDNHSRCTQQKTDMIDDTVKQMRGKGLDAEKLRREHDFIGYMRQLRLFAKRYTVFAASDNTPCGPAFTPEIAAEMTAVGFEINLSDKFRRSYAAVIDAGELVYEGIAPSTAEAVNHELLISGTPVMLRSVGYDVPEDNTAQIIIDGKNYSPGGCGLCFVVFDMVTKTLIDAVNFNTYLENFPYRRPAETFDRLRKYKDEHPEISVLCFGTPSFPALDLSENEKFIRQYVVSRPLILQNLDKPVFALNEYLKSPDEVAEALSAPTSYLDINGVRRFEDLRGKCVNIVGGRRVTRGQPNSHKRTVYVVGGCRIFGVGSRDEGTIASQLQRLFNEKAPEQEAIVQNYGFYLEELNGVQSNEELEILESLPVAPGDIVLCYLNGGGAVAHIGMWDAAKRPHGYGEVFFDMLHYTENGNRMIADRLFDALQKENFFSAASQSVGTHTKPAEPDYPGLDNDTKKELAEYKNILTEFYESMFGITIGAIVMNCNPFTLGHRYLVETAAAQADHLIIFVVQEDRSEFPFDDRLKLIDEGTADIQNVTVIPSGRFIISSLTFSDYFNKSELQERVVDSSLDVTLFAREIAPCLNISVRFVGEEPFDSVTRQYNDAMRAILPQYGIELIEIPRLELGGAPVSASRVRELLKVRDFGEIAKIVPESTLEYLRARF